MADVRSLLRQQKAARRIEHPYAAYSDAGKLLCTLCREQLKAESFWDGHLQGEGHRARLQQLRQKQQQKQQQQVPELKVSEHDSNTQEEEEAVSSSTGPTVQKRKLGADEDDDVDMGDAIRRKRSRPDIGPLIGVSTPEHLSAGSSKESTNTPPSLTRKASNTPSQGVEMQIPSRPATPAHRDGGGSGSSSTGGAGGGYFSLSSQPGGQLTPLRPRLANATSAAFAAATAAANASSDGPSAATVERPSSTAPEVDESEWAAFEADIAATDAPYDTDAVISAPALTAEEAAAKDAAAANDEEQKAQADVDIQDEKEEATRVLEEEFDEMSELEARVRKFKEQREGILKRRRESQGQEGMRVGANGVKTLSGADGGQLNGDVVEEDDEEDSDDEDDWDGFRFRAA